MRWVGGVWQLRRGDEVMGEITITEADFPWLSGSFVARAGFAEVAALFAEELALSTVIADDDSAANVEAWEAAYVRIVETMTLVAPSGPVAAQTPDRPTETAQFPSAQDLRTMTTSGSYLAARQASVERDAMSAATFYRSALRTDPKNNELLDRAFISSLAEGDIAIAVKLADRILAIDKSNRVARLVVGVHNLKLKVPLPASKAKLP